MCCYSYSNTDSFKEWIFLFVGALLGLFISLLWKNLSDYWFKISVLNPIIGEYKITLKNGQKFLNLDTASITKAKGRKITFFVKTDNGDADGEIEFISNNYGKGFYTHRGNNLYGFYEFILLPNNKISALRKYTTDEKTNERRHSESIETSFIWEKQK